MMRSMNSTKELPASKKQGLYIEDLSHKLGQDRACDLYELIAGAPPAYGSKPSSKISRYEAYQLTVKQASTMIETMLACINEPQFAVEVILESILENQEFDAC